MNATQQRVFDALLESAAESRHPEIRISTKAVSDEIGVSRRSVDAAVQYLEEEGWLTRSGYGRIRVTPKSFHGQDLRGKCLAGLDLTGSDLEDTDLREVNLSGARLRGAKMCRSNMSGANLEGADLTNADLHDAHMLAVHARGAKFRGADLVFAQISKSDLRDTDFTVAKLYGTQMRHCQSKGMRISGFFDPREFWAGNTDTFGTSTEEMVDTQNNHILAARRFREIDSTNDGRCLAARVEAIMFGCYPQCIEDALSVSSRVFEAWHRGLDQMWQDGRVDWGFYYSMKFEAALVLQRLQGRHPDDLLLEVLGGADDELVRQQLRATLSEVLPQGFSGLGVTREYLERLEGGVSAAHWNRDRSPRYPVGPPMIDPKMRQSALRAMGRIQGLDARSLVDLISKRVDSATPSV